MQINKAIEWDEKTCLDKALGRYASNVRLPIDRILCENTRRFLALEMALSYLEEMVQKEADFCKGVFVIPDRKQLFGKTAGVPYTRVLEKVKKRFFVSTDLSRGIELYPLPVFDDSGSKYPTPPKPAGLNYITTNIMSEPIKSLTPARFPEETYQISCDCTSGCTDCICVKLGRKGTKNADECLYLPEFGLFCPRSSNTYDNTLIVCCGPLCKCSSSCNFRMENLFHLHQYEVFKEDEVVGYRVRTLNNINYGEILCEFAGEVVSSNFNADYAFHLLSHDDISLRNRLAEITEEKISKAAWNAFKLEDFYVDPYASGNIARLIKHSCLPNLVVIRAVVNDWRPQMHHWVLVACAPIPAGCELSLNYGVGYYETNLKGKCKCNSILCGKFKSVWQSLRPQIRTGVLNDYLNDLHNLMDEMQKRRDENDIIVTYVHVNRIRTKQNNAYEPSQKKQRLQ